MDDSVEEPWGENMQALQDNAERHVVFKAIDSFWMYGQAATYNIVHRRLNGFHALPRAHQEILRQPQFDILNRLKLVQDAVDANGEIGKRIAMHASRTMGLGDDPKTAPWRGFSTPDDLAKAATTINQFYRDWSAEGEPERMAHFQPILDYLKSIFPSNREDIKVLLPGSGLGRLVFEICQAGFNVEGNEISYHALFASEWILNTLKPNEKFTLFPFVTKFSNQVSATEQLKAVAIPDIHPGSEMHEKAGKGQMSVAASDFLTAYQQDHSKDQFDAVATVFFIDTAPNVLRYIEAIKHTLKPGGKWINLGPLLWHFEEHGPANPEATKPGRLNPTGIPGIEEPGNIELTYEDVLALVEQMEFQVEFSEIIDSPPVGYIQQRSSLMQSTFVVAHFIATKLSDEFRDSQ